MCGLMIVPFLCSRSLDRCLFDLSQLFLLFLGEGDLLLALGDRDLFLYLGEGLRFFPRGEGDLRFSLGDLDLVLFLGEGDLLDLGDLEDLLDLSFDLTLLLESSLFPFLLTPSFFLSDSLPRPISNNIINLKTILKNYLN